MFKPTILVLGSCNVDFTTYVPRLPLAGETLLGSKFSTRYGGKGANQCIAASRLGAEVSMIAKVGSDDWGIKYKQYLQAEGVNTEHVTFCEETATGIAQICVSADGENHIVVVEGANARLSYADVQAARVPLQMADVLVAQLESPPEATLRAFELTRGKCVLNVAPVRGELDRELLNLTDVLCLNRLEAAQLTGIHSQTVTDLDKTVAELLDSYCETVVVTLGAEGAVFASRSDPVPTHVHTDVVTPVDTTGAGDAFMGALATFLLSDAEFHQIVGAACSVAARSVTKEGTHDSYPTDFVPFNRTYSYKRLRP